MASPLTFVSVSKDDLREMFNSAAFQRRITSRELRPKLLADSVPTPTPVGEPVGTHSQTIAYHDGRGKRIATVHQYLRPDGTIGASGRQDPKAIRLGDVVYYIDLAHMF
ncbi:MAG: hypothetical protein EPO22_05360 [Dehalococcoidia bacterium]|nr:MAG: hypothetical protein EPO22_05360 [Dehalococcoidia bacterium]